jgi:hypothetical protein
VKSDSSTEHADKVLAAHQRLVEAKKRCLEIDRAWQTAHNELESARAELEYLASEYKR